jgi:DNA-binding CsgD family transcriptional regulator
MDQYRDNQETREMTPVPQTAFRGEPVFLVPPDQPWWSEPELYNGAEQLRLEVLTVHLEAVLAVTRFAATTASLGFTESANRAYTRAVMGYRRVKRLLHGGPHLPEHLEYLERLRIALPESADWAPDPAPPVVRHVQARLGDEAPEECLEALTPREMQVLKLIAEGNSSKKVAYLLGISFKTAVCHRYNIMEKLNLHDVSSLVRYAIRRKLVQA